MKERSLFCLLFLLFCGSLFAQEAIHFGEHVVLLEANVKNRRGTTNKSSLELGIPVGDKINVVVQFNSAQIDYMQLVQRGIVLEDYLGANAYFASVPPGKTASDFAETGVRSVVPIRAEWKIVRGLHEYNYPEWAFDGQNLTMSLCWFPTVSWKALQTLLDTKGIKYKQPTLFARNVEVQATREQLLALAETECIASLTWVKPPQSITNRDAARLSGANILQMPVALGGRALLGTGIRVGVWDANVAQHVDYGKRVHVKEFEIGLAASGGHGMHTTGTIAGSGLLNERARGMAPEAEVWTWNFNMQSNGKTAAQEMYETFEDEQISLTSNSYGLGMNELCKLQEYLNYTTLGDPNLDALAYQEPTLTHVFSAGNDQGACKQPYSHSTNYGKNIISVAAINSYGKMSEFSSFGPLLDGRIFPIISARGVAVYSTIPNQSYLPMDGTSMACPTVTGHLALLTQRWKQLHGNANPYNYFLKALIANTATDAGNPGPDYKFGFGILDGAAAINAMEKEWYQLDQLAQSETQKELTLNVPAGVKELRVMLCWNDPVANRVYKTGDLPLVNDLDLKIVHNGNEYFPYSLDYKNPDANAVAVAKNAVDNIEQIVIPNPSSGSYTVSVTGVVKQGAQQPYAVVWYFDEQHPTLAAPLAGEIYAPGENVYIRTQHFDASFQVELSTDGGNSYRVLGDCSAYSTFKLPENIAPTNKAKLRLTDKSGYLLIMDGLFTIMPQVHNVVLADKACSTEGWLLKWDAVSQAAKYKILKANLISESYEEIAEVNAPQTQYALPKEQIASNAQNIFAVQAISTEGIKGQRSIGVLAQRPTPIAITASDLPYRETFIELPLPHATLVTGKNLSQKTQDVPSYVQAPLGSQMLVWQVSKTETNWTEPFKQRDNVGAIEICGLDLTNFGTSTPLFFRTYMTMTPNIASPGALLRLMVNGKVVNDILNREIIEGDGDEHSIVWDLSNFRGQKISLALEVALEAQGDAIVLVNYQIEKPEAVNDVAIEWVNRPVINERELMGVDTIQFKIANKTLTPVTSVPVSVQVDGKVVYTKNVEKLAPYEDMVISFPYDFSYDAPHRFLVETRVDVANDANPANNVKTFEVYNMGDVIRMPEVKYHRFLGVRFPRVPYITKKVKGAQLFVDGSGSLAPYKEEEQAVLQILPRDPNKVVQVTFHELSLAVGDSLSVYTGNVPSDLKVKPKDATWHLTGDAYKGKVIVSEAANGGLTFRLVGYNEHPGAGWIAEVREIPQTNQWRIKSLCEVSTSDPNQSKVEVVVENLTPAPFYNVGLTLSAKEGTKRYEIPELAPRQETRFVIPHTIDVTPPMRWDVEITLARDGNMEDNSAQFTVSHDKAWNGGTIQKPEKLWITDLQMPGEASLEMHASNSIYYSQGELPLYTQSLNALKLSFSDIVKGEYLPAKIRLWIDANNDEAFDDATELYEVLLEENQSVCWAELDLTKLANISDGKHRMRIMLSTADGYSQFRANGKIAWGHIIDLKAVVHKAKSPQERELSISSIEELQTKRNLSASTPIKFRVQNNGLVAFDKVKAHYQINDLPAVEETIVCNLPAHGGEEQLTFSQTADLSGVGKYDIKVTLQEVDANSENNSSSLTVYNIAEKSSDLYGLRYVGERKESLLLPELGADINREATIEGWWKLDAAQRCDLVNSEGFWLASYVGERDVADNSLVVLVGEGGGFASVHPVLQPGKWQHIAVSMHEEGLKGFRTTHLKVYVDGVEVPMRKVSNSGFNFFDVYLNVGLKGENAMFRLWKKERQKEEIVADMLRSVRNSEHALPEECLGEFLFTEGKGAVTAFGEERYGLIQSERNDVWQRLTEVVANVVAEGEVIPAKRSVANEFTITMAENFAQLNKVKLNFVLGWSGAKLYFRGNEVQTNQEFDFSNLLQPLSFKAKKEGLFGVILEQDFTVRLVKEPSAACDMLKLSLLKAKNSWLKEDVVVNTPNELVLLRAFKASATSEIDMSRVVLVVDAISANAKLYLGEQEQPVTSDITVDLRQPIVLTVRAANNRSEKRYVIRLAFEQSITWTTTKIVRDYTKEPLQLDATASSKLPIIYRSLDPKVATVDNEGNLLTAGIGKTKIIATQPGNEHYLAAPSIEREVEVNRIPLTITMEDAKMEEGDMLPEPVLKYEGLQFKGTEPLFETPYRIVLPDGSSWRYNMLPLTPGTYKVEPAERGPVPIDGYMVTREDGKLIVTSAQKAKAVTFHIKDEKNNPLNGVTLRCGYASGVINNGYTLPLLSGNYSISLTKDGYTTFVQDLSVRQSAIDVEVRLSKKEHHLQYVAGDNGSVQGVTSQYVADGADGEMVVAVPTKISHRFKQWSDGYREAARTDKNVHSSQTLTAEFEAFECQLTYHLSEGGICLTNNLTQTVLPGGNATPVEVKAALGYVFVGWSDGLKTKIRTDNKVLSDMTVTALFERAHFLKWSEDFEFGENQLADWKLAKPFEGKGWLFSKQADLPEIATPRGYCLLLDPRTDNATPWYANCWATTPWLSIEEREPTAEVAISYARYFQSDFSEGAKVEVYLEYCFEDGVWHKAQDVTENSVGSEESYTLTADKLSGHTALRFRWNVTAKSFNIYLALDNIVVRYTPEATEQMLRYIADEHGVVREQGKEKGFSYLELRTPANISGAMVEAVPDAGYVFAGWSDKKEGALRSDKNALTVKAFFAPEPKEEYELVYKAAANGVIEGQSYQKVRSGENSSPVFAKPANGYKFSHWSDESTDNPRSDRATSNATYEAYFVNESAFYTVTLLVESGEGELTIVGYTNEMLNKVPEGTLLTVKVTPRDEKKWALESMAANDEDITTKKAFRVLSNVVVKAKFKDISKTATQDAELSKLFVAPNPFNEKLRIANIDTPNTSYELINATGTVVRSGMIENGETLLSTASLEAGVYLLRIISPMGIVKVVRVVKA